MIKKSDIGDMYYLSPMQGGMLFHYLMDKESPAYFEQTSYRVNLEIDYRLFEQAFNQIIEKYDVLRTIFIYEKLQRPLQVVLKKRKAAVHYEDISHLDEDAGEKKVNEFKRKDKERGFDLSKDILIRLAILKVADEKYEIIWSFHHIIMDGWCIGIVIKDMLQAYNALTEGKTVNLSPAAPYKNYIKWLEMQDKDAGINYWKHLLEHYDNQAVVPRGMGRKTNKYEQKAHRVRIDRVLSKEFIRISNENNVTMSTTIQTVWGILLQKYNDTDDVVFGAIVSGRPGELEGVETMVGLFINAIPIRVKSAPGETFTGLVKKIQAQMIQSRSYEYVPLVEIQSHSLLKGELINQLFLFENYPIEKEIEHSGPAVNSSSPVESVEIFEQTSYDLNVIVTFREQLGIKITYNASVYDKHIIERIGNHLERISEQITAGEIPVEEIEIITPEEKNQILFEFNNNSAPYPEAQAYELFEKQEAQGPGKIAVVDEDNFLSYGQFNRKTNRLARLFQYYGIGDHQIVGILLNRTPWLIETIMATWKVGGSYIPMETDYPPQRIHEILKNSGTRFLITQSEFVPGYIEKNFQGSIIKLDEEKERIHKMNDSNLNLKIDINNLAYILYTSGSTGKPKGAMVEHIGSMNHMKGKINDTQMDARSIMAQTGPQTFDISIWQFYAPLTLGGKTVMYSHSIQLEPERFITRLIRDQVTILEVVPSYLTILLDYFDEATSHTLPLRYMVPTGEELKMVLVKKWFQLFPDIKLINTYGPTEASDDIAHYVMDKAPRYDSVPLGKPLQNLNMYIVDRHMKLCPIGIKGEICVSGIGVGRGYLKDEGRTAKVFMEDPFLEEKGVRLYKMGDWGCQLPDGNFLFLGRKDYQVKIRGHLIECGEIENRLLDIPHVKETVVIDREDIKGNKYLCAYLVSDSTLSIPEVKARLSVHLPDYMIPAYFLEIDRMPLTSNGKIDRKALPLPQASIGENTEYDAPRDEVEEVLAEIWEELLPVSRPGINDNFFDSGGHSLNGMALISNIHKKLDVEIPIRELFKNPTIRKISEYIKNADVLKYASLDAAEKKEYYPASLTQNRFYILQNLEPEHIADNIPAIFTVPGEPNKDRLEKTFRKLIERHESLRTSFELIDGNVVLRIHDGFALDIEFYEVPGKDVKNVVYRFIRPFNLDRAPLLRVGVIKPGDGNYILIMDMHHIISDALSFSILSKEFIALYENVVLSPLPLQYTDYSEWLRSCTEKEKIFTQGEYWVNQFEAEVPLLRLRTDYPRPLVKSFEGNEINFWINAEETGALNRLALREEVSLFILLFSIYNILLSRLTGQGDIVVGVGVLNRPHPDLMNIIGLFFNTVPLRNQVNEEQSFRDFLRQVKEKNLEAFENQGYPVDILVEKLLKRGLLTRDLGRNPLFDTMFDLRNVDEKKEDETEASATHIAIKPYPIENRTSRFDLFLKGTRYMDIIQMKLEYATALFKESTARKITEYYMEIVKQILENKNIKIADISIASQQLQVNSNADQNEYMNFVF